MKLDFVEVCGFRGFRDKARFEFTAGFAVFSGRNGAGKSTVLDAVDFAITGTINKFPVTKAKGGGLGEHIWWLGAGRPEAHYVTVGFVGADGTRFSITRQRERGFEASVANPFSRLCVAQVSSSPPIDTLMQTTLIRDESIVALSVDLPEQARATAVRAAIGGLVGPDHSQRTSELLKASNAAKQAQEQRVKAAEAELGRCLSELTDARSAAERSPDVSQAMRTIESYAISLPPEPRARVDAIRRYIAERRRALQQIETGRRTIEILLPELTYARSREAARNLQSALQTVERAKQEKERTDHMLALAERADASERASDIYAAHLTAILEHGQGLGLQDGHCPLCAASRSQQEFEAAIAGARARLAARGERLAASMKALDGAQAAVNTATQALVIAQQDLARETERRARVDEQVNQVQEIYRSNALSAPADDPAEAQRLILAEQERLTRLEGALYILETSGAADRVASLEARVTTLRERVDAESAKLVESERAAEAAKQIDSSAKTVANQFLSEQFDTVMPLLKELYRRLRPHSEWTNIDSDFGGKVRASLNFTVGDGHNIQFLFSSGQRRAAGLAFLLAIHLSRRWCEWRTLLLDDPVQHIDDYRALNLVEVLAAIRRSGQQIIIAVEDAALADLLCRRLRSSIGEIGRRFELQSSKTGTAELVDVQDIYPMPREVLRRAQAS
jgi:chromosome segregation protein